MRNRVPWLLIVLLLAVLVWRERTRPSVPAEVPDVPAAAALSMLAEVATPVPPVPEPVVRIERTLNLEHVGLSGTMKRDMERRIERLESLVESGGHTRWQNLDDVERDQILAQRMVLEAMINELAEAPSVIEKEIANLERQRSRITNELASARALSDRLNAALITYESAAPAEEENR